MAAHPLTLTPVASYYPSTAAVGHTAGELNLHHRRLLLGTRKFSHFLSRAPLRPIPPSSVMAEIFWDNDNDLPALDLFDPSTALPPLDGFTTSPLLTETGLAVNFPEPSLEPELPAAHPALVAP